MNQLLLNTKPVRLDIGGAAISTEAARTVSEVLVRQALAAATVAEITFANPPARIAETLRPGQPLRVLTHGDSLLEGEVTGIEYEYDGAGAPVLRVCAHDRLQPLRRRCRIRAISATSAGKVGAELAAGLGVGFSELRPSADRELVIQRGESDFDLLADLAGAAGLYPYLDGDTLKLIGLEGEGEPIGLSMGRTLLSARLALSSERSIARAEARSWLTTTLAHFKGTAGTASQDLFEMRDLGLGEGNEAPTQQLILNALADSEKATQALAQATMDRSAAAEAFVEGVAVGNPTLGPGRPIEIVGVAAIVSGRYVITEALHRFDADRGYRTEFDTRPPPRTPRAPPIFSVGAVSATADPQGYGRCRVKLPALADTDSGWLQVMVAGAGDGKGLVALPEIGDDVLVVFPDGDPARGIVLGGLYGQKSLPRGARGKKSRPFVLRTGTGQALELSADSALARLSNSSGSLLELTPGGMRLAAAGDLAIEAPGKTITIRAAAVNFEQG